jgi:Na+/H+-dicarboxylate symporter
MPLHGRILAGMLLGVVVGLAANLAAPTLGELGGWTGTLDRALGLVGDLFLRALKLIAVPIVLFSLVLGAASLDDVRKLSRIGSRTIAIYLTTTAAAVSIGLALANVTQPGTHLGADLRDRLAAEGAEGVGERIAKTGTPTTDLWSAVRNLVPENPFAALAQADMLQVVIVALLVGLMLVRIPQEKAEPVLRVVDGLNEVVLELVQVVMRAAPLAVFCLVARVVAQMGVDVLGALAVYALTVVGGLAIVMLGVYAGLLRLLTPVSVSAFLRAIAPAQLLAFSSSSSNATLPLTMRCVKENLGVDDEVASFVLPLGSTVNMDGTALYQGVATVFIAQLYGIDLTWTDQATVVLTATLASIGTAGVPGVGLVMLVMVLQSVGIPEEAMAGGLAIIFGIDRILDMCRTVINVTGDCVVAVVIGHLEGGLRPPADAP